MITAALLLLASCTTTVDVTVTDDGGDEGDGSTGSVSTTAPSGSTGPTGSETGEPSSTGASDDSGGSTGSTGGEESGSTTDAPACVVVDADAGPTCVCDGVVSDPDACGCADDPVGWCSCGAVDYPEPCVHPCVWSPDVSSCSCDGVSSHPTACGCVLFDGDCVCPGDPAVYPGTMCTDDVCTQDTVTGECFCDSSPAACWCDDLVPPQPCPT